MFNVRTGLGTQARTLCWLYTACRVKNRSHVPGSSGAGQWSAQFPVASNEAAPGCHQGACTYMRPTVCNCADGQLQAHTSGMVEVERGQPLDLDVCVLGYVAALEQGREGWEQSLPRNNYTSERFLCTRQNGYQQQVPVNGKGAWKAWAE